MKIESMTISGNYFPVKIIDATIEEINRLEESIIEWRKTNANNRRKYSNM